MKRTQMKLWVKILGTGDRRFRSFFWGHHTIFVESVRDEQHRRPRRFVILPLHGPGWFSQPCLMTRWYPSWNPEVFEHERVREPRIIGGLKLWFLGWSQNSEWAPLSTINQVGLSVERSKEALGCTWCFLGPQAWTYIFHTARGVDPWLN